MSETLTILRELIVRSSVVRGLSDNEAKELAQSVEEQFRIKCGGDTSYIHALPTDVKYKKIREDFDGTNRDEVIKKHDISVKTFYRAIAPKAPNKGFSPE